MLFISSSTEITTKEYNYSSVFYLAESQNLDLVHLGINDPQLEINTRVFPHYISSQIYIIELLISVIYPP